MPAVPDESSLPVAAATYRGSMANMLSDDADAVCLRGYELPVEMSLGGNPALRAAVPWSGSDTRIHG